MSSPKVTEGVNEQGGVEVKVNTVDYRSPAGEDQDTVKEKVQVLHEIDDGGAKPAGTGAAGFLGKAAAAVGGTFQSAKDAVSGGKKEEKVEVPEESKPKHGTGEAGFVAQTAAGIGGAFEAAKEKASGHKEEEKVEVPREIKDEGTGPGAFIGKANAAVSESFQNARDAVSEQMTKMNHEAATAAHDHETEKK